MLLIHGALPLGGIETFFVRLAEERSKKGLTTKVLLLSDRGASDPELLKKMSRYATIYFKDDVFFRVPIFLFCITLLTPVRKKELDDMLSGIEQIHVANGRNAMLANRLVKLSNVNLLLTVGFYHSLEFLWGNNYIPYFEKIHRKFVFDVLPKENILVFSGSIIELYQKKGRVNLVGANTFRIGVVSGANVQNGSQKRYKKDSKTLRICSVGRLVEFKTYNLWMIDVIFSLIADGVDVEYDIYGDGPLYQEIQDKISRLNLVDNIHLKGQLIYSNFGKIITNYDLFIGSGTAIIEASSLGVCSIVGVESIQSPQSYGYFTSCADFDYNLGSLDIEKVPVQGLIKKFIAMAVSEKNELSKEHVDVMSQFYIETCSDNFEKLKDYATLQEEFIVNGFFYEINTLFHKILKRILKSHPLNFKYGN